MSAFLRERRNVFAKGMGDGCNRQQGKARFDANVADEGGEAKPRREPL